MAMRYQVAMMSSLARHRLLKTEAKKSVQVRVGAEGGFLGTGFFADIYEEYNDIRDELMKYNEELSSYIDEIDDEATKQKFVSYFKTTWAPFRNEYIAYRNEVFGGWFKTIFDARSIWKKLQQYRAEFLEQFTLAKKFGFKTHGPLPTPPKTSLPEDLYDKAGKLWDVGGEIWSVVKIVIYVGLMVVSLGFLISTLHGIL